MNFVKIKKISAKYFIYLICLFSLVALIFIAMRNPATENGDSFFVKLRNKVINNEAVIYMLHSYHSLRKLPDILFFPYFFRESNIPAYNLYVSAKDIRALNDSLPDDPISGYLTDENRIWVKGVFIAGDYEEEVKVKYRGTNANHWNSLQKSWRIKFPKEHLFRGMETMDLVVPYDRDYFIEPLNLYRGKKLGLTTLDMSFSRLKLNGQDSGVYLTYERLEQGWLESRRMPVNAGIFMGDDAMKAVMDPETQVAIKTNLYQGTFYLNKLSAGADDDSVAALKSIIEETDDETFKKVIGNVLDLKKFYAWNIVNILAGSGHRADYFYDGNILTIFNSVTGRFEFSPWDVEITSTAILPGGEYDDKSFKLSRRIFSIPEFRQERNAMLAAYLKDGIQLKDDLAFYNNLFEQTKGDFYSDSAKLYNNFQFLGQVNLYRNLAIDNFSRAAKVLSYNSDYYSDKTAAAKVKMPANLKPAGSFSRILETGYTIGQFIAANPSFIKRGEKTIALPPGVHIFKKDVIVPSGLELVIDSGAVINLGAGVSFISYSPVTAKGVNGGKIKIARLNALEPWGAFAVINTAEKKSLIDNVEFDGGNVAAGTTVNGINISGMAAFHNADVDISNSSFKNSGGDDGLNVKYGKAAIVNSVFSNNFSDGIDMDFGPKETVVKNNKFYDNGYGEGGGDGIDISWSDFKIENNYIKGCSDKGISVGESSKPTIKNNTIEQSDIGIAVKDSAIAEIIGNTISQVRIGIDAYQKKQYFGGGIANLSGNIIKEAKTDYSKDNLSEINILP